MELDSTIGENLSSVSLKVNAIVLAAGISNKYLDFSEFKKKATEIFCRAYTAIYDEQISELISNPTSIQDYLNNSIWLIESVRKKTRDPKLSSINPSDLQSGQDQAIIPLINILYNEGQRLWFESEQNRQTPRTVHEDEPAVEEEIPENEPQHFAMFEMTAEKKAAMDDLLEKARQKYQNKNQNKPRPTSAPSRKKWVRDTRILEPPPSTVTIMGRPVSLEADKKHDTSGGGGGGGAEIDSMNSSLAHKHDADIIQRHPKINCQACLDHTSSMKKIIDIFEHWNVYSMDAVSSDPQSQSFRLFIHKLNKSKTQIIEVMKELGKVRSNARSNDREMGMIRGELLKYVEKMTHRITDLAFSTGRNPDVMELKNWLQYLTKKLDGFVTSKKQNQSLKRTINLLTTSLFAASNMVTDHKSITTDLREKLDQAQIFVEKSRKEIEKIDILKSELSDSRGEVELLNNKVKLLVGHILNLEQLERSIILKKEKPTTATASTEEEENVSQNQNEEGKGEDEEEEEERLRVEREKEGNIPLDSRCHPTSLISNLAVDSFRKRVYQKIEIVKRKDYKIEEGIVKEAKLSEKLRKTENEREKYKEEIQMYKQEQKILEQEISTLQEERSKLKKELLKDYSTMRRIEDLEGEVEKIQAEKNEMFTRLTQHLTERTQQLNETTAELDELRVQYHEAVEKRDEFEIEKIRTQIEKSDLSNQVKVLTHKLEESEEEVDRLKKQLDLVLETNVHMTETLNILEDRLHQIEKSQPNQKIQGRSFHAKNKYKNSHSNSLRKTDLLESDVPLPEPRFFAAYHFLEPLDLVISIEHSNGSDLAPTTPRSADESKEYLHYANLFLRTLARIVHDHSLSVRLGVLRIETTVEGRHLDDSPRVGAFEIQIAYRGINPTQPVIFEILHSKITSNRWPSKSVLEKRLATFISKACIASHSEQIPVYEGMSTDGLCPYPVGQGPWHLTQLAHPGWNYDVMGKRKKENKEADLVASLHPPPAPSLSAPPPPLPPSIPSSTLDIQPSVVDIVPPPFFDVSSVISMTHPNYQIPKYETQSTPTTLQSLLEARRRVISQSPFNPSIFSLENIQWVFDSRAAKLRELSYFSAGAEVCVSGLSLHILGQPISVTGNERFRLNGVLKTSPGPFSHYISVRLRYYALDFKVRLSSCILWSQFTAPVLYYNPRHLPECLDLLLLLVSELYKEKVHEAWKPFSAEDTIVERLGLNWVQVTRDSYFHQTRALVWEVEMHNVFGLFSESVTRSSTGTPQGLVRHPRTSTLVDLQACYADAALDWVFAQCGGSLADIYQLFQYSPSLKT